MLKKWLNKFVTEKESPVSANDASVETHTPSAESAEQPIVNALPTQEDPKIQLNYPGFLQNEDPNLFAVVSKSVDDVLKATQSRDFSVLAKHSPGLESCDWKNYLNCSKIRMMRVVQMLQKLSLTGGDLLDYGSYLGNFSLMFSRLGFNVTSADSYIDYDCFHEVTDLLKQHRVELYDYKNVEYNLSKAPNKKFDVVICMSVIEHIPHTPREMLEAIDSVLKPGGIFILETPNLAYIYNRQKLLRGQSVHLPIELQYESEVPFVGHHREYTFAEIEWIIKRMNYEMLEHKLFNYSLYGLPYLQGRDLENYLVMQEDKTCREIILTASQKPDDEPN